MEDKEVVMNFHDRQVFVSKIWISTRSFELICISSSLTVTTVNGTIILLDNQLGPFEFGN